MIDINPMLLCDTYKQVHMRMYSENLAYLTSYWVPRKSMLKNTNKMVFFGLQAFIKEYLVDYFENNFFDQPWDVVKESFTKYMNIQLGEGNYELKRIKALHSLEFLPIDIKALPEGSLVNMGVPCIEITNTNPNFPWVVQWIECLLQCELWKMCNHATIGHMYYKLAKEWYDKTVDDELDPRNAFSDFGMRGMSCIEEATRCSAAWLLSANKTSTIPALPWLDKFYNADCSYHHIGVGAVSTEHSVIGANNAIGIDEEAFLKKMLTELYPNTSFSFLGDTYDYWNFVDNIIPKCKKEILEHNGKLLIRPDSGNIVEISVKTIEKLWDMFGGTINSKGYKVLDPHIGIIYGDGCTLNNLREIWNILESKGFAANNIIFGVGAFCFTAFFEDDKLIVNSRDTFGIAMKASRGVFVTEDEVKEVMIYKDPKTDTDNLKKSHKGLVYVYKEGNDFKYKDELLKNEYDALNEEKPSALRTVFVDGWVPFEETFMTIRKRLNEQV